MRYPTASFFCLLLVACGDNSHLPASHHQAPSTAEPIAQETELLRLTLSASSQQQLGIETVHVTEQSVRTFRQLSGEIVVPPLVTDGVPTGSTVNLQQLALQQVAADAEVSRAKALQHLARVALDRAEALVQDEAGSERVRDEAIASLATAQAALVAANRQRSLLGPAVEDMLRQRGYWVRVSVFSADLDTVQQDAPARIRPLGGQGQVLEVEARPAKAPPSANAITGTVDLYYALPESGDGFLVGQRVAVELPIAATTKGPGLPSAAIVRDIYGGEWVYQKTAPDTYVRQRVEVAAERGGRALLSRGLAVGDEVVTVGAAELFGTEFGAAH